MQGSLVVEVIGAVLASQASHAGARLHDHSTSEQQGTEILYRLFVENREHLLATQWRRLLQIYHQINSRIFCELLRSLQSGRNSIFLELFLSCANFINEISFALFSSMYP